MNRKSIIVVVFVVGICSAIVWYTQHLTEQAEADLRYRLETVYQEFLPEGEWFTSHRYYEKQEVFTDAVERFRFDGANQTLVNHLVQKYRLSLAAKSLNNHFIVPHWWDLPEDGVYYLRGSGNDYTMLVFDGKAGRVFFELSQD